MRGFIERLKRGRLYQGVAAYLVGAWILVQVAMALEEGLSLPGWVDTAVILLVAAGFPVVAGAMWWHERRLTTLLARRRQHRDDALPASPAPALLEREKALGSLDDALADAAARNGSIALVSGDAGIGKSSLIRAFVVRNHASARTFVGACEALLTPQPLGALHDVAAALGGAVERLIDSEGQRLKLFNAVLDALDAAARPAALVFEDVHWADDATLDLIRFLGRRISDRRGLLIITTRPQGLLSDHPLARIVGEIPRDNLRRIPLEPLSFEAISRLAEAQGRADAAELYAATGGNPFFATEVLAARGRDLPATVRDAVLARTGTLSPAARAVVDAIATSPGKAEPWLIEAVCDAPASALREAVDEGVIVDEGAAFRFRHELARQAVEDAKQPSARIGLHAKVLRALEGHEGIPPSRLMHHAQGAGDVDAISRHGPVAAEAAARAGAHRMAAAHYDAVLAQADRLGDEMHAQLLENCAREHEFVGDYGAAIELAERAMAARRRTGVPASTAEALYRLVRLMIMSGNSDGALALSRQALAETEAAPESAERALACAAAANIAYLRDEIAETQRLAERAIELARSVGREDILAYALVTLGSVLLRGNERVRARLLVREGRAVALRVGNEQEVLRSYVNIGISAVWDRDYGDDGLADLEEGIAWARARDVDVWTDYLLGALAQADFDRGHWREAEARVRIVLERLHGTLGLRAFPAVTMRARLAVRRGEDAEAERLLALADTLPAVRSEAQRAWPVAVTRAEQAWLRGNLAPTTERLRAALALALPGTWPWARGELAWWLARAGAPAAEHGEIAEPYAASLVGDWRGAAAAWARIGCPYDQALALSEGDAAARREALEIFDTVGAAPAAALMHAALG